MVKNVIAAVNRSKSVVMICGVTALLLAAMCTMAEPVIAAEYISQGGLTWMPATKVSFTWPDADAYCAGKSGWRLPTKEELSAMFESEEKNGPGGQVIGVPGSTVWDGQGDIMWSSSKADPIDRSPAHWNVSLGAGFVNAYYDTDKFFVTCVR
jgi:hypothetical protein